MELERTARQRRGGRPPQEDHDPSHQEPTHRRQDSAVIAGYGSQHCLARHEPRRGACSAPFLTLQLSPRTPNSSSSHRHQEIIYNLHGCNDGCLSLYKERLDEQLKARRKACAHLYDQSAIHGTAQKKTKSLLENESESEAILGNPNLNANLTLTLTLPLPLILTRHP